MTPISLDDAKRIMLPKWPQCLIVGPDVTVEQAKDIIFRTDDFFTDVFEFFGGNNHRWIEWARKTLGLTQLRQEIQHLVDDEGYWVQSIVRRILQKRVGYVESNYLFNRWASSSFIYGAHGWCSPQGKIQYVDNIGKWPSTEEVIQEMEDILKAFPYVEMYVSLFDNEGCEAVGDDDPLVTLHMKEGTGVRAFAGTLEPHGGVRMTRERMNCRPTDVFSNSHLEQGLSDDIIREFAERLKPHLVGLREAAVEEYAQMQKREKEDEQDESTESGKD